MCAQCFLLFFCSFVRLFVPSVNTSSMNAVCEMKIDSRNQHGKGIYGQKTLLIIQMWHNLISRWNNSHHCGGGGGGDGGNDESLSAKHSAPTDNVASGGCQYLRQCWATFHSWAHFFTCSQPSIQLEIVILRVNALYLHSWLDGWLETKQLRRQWQKLNSHKFFHSDSSGWLMPVAALHNADVVIAWE